MKVQNASVDWLTMTTKDEKEGQKWYTLYRKYRGIKRKEGNKERPFHNGFYGGLRICKMTVGYSDAIGYIVIVSGRDAQRLFYLLSSVTNRVTRLDLCIDFLLEKPHRLADWLFAQQALHSENKQRKYSVFLNSEGGETFYLGSRKSSQYGRVYDKGVESNVCQPGLLWRAEVEWKKPLAGKIARGLAAQKLEKRELAICDTVSEWFAERAAVLFPARSANNVIHISVEKRITTAEAKLSWLRSQIRPSVADLIDVGYGKEVLGALGLDMKRLNRCLMAEY